MQRKELTPFEESMRTALEQAAAADGHAVVNPKFVYFRDGEIVGYIGSVPLLFIWAHSKKTSARDTVPLCRMIPPGVVCVCDSDSPFFPYMGRLGFVPCEANLFVKTGG